MTDPIKAADLPVGSVVNVNRPRGIRGAFTRTPSIHEQYGGRTDLNAQRWAGELNLSGADIQQFLDDGTAEIVSIGGGAHLLREGLT